jgi:hypothetical protein
MARTRIDERARLKSKEQDPAATDGPLAADDPRREDAAAEQVRPETDPKRKEPEPERPPKHLPRPTRR